MKTEDLVKAVLASDRDHKTVDRLLTHIEDNAYLERKARYSEALAKFAADCPPIHKDRSISLGRGGGYTYATYEAIMAVVGPILAKHKLTVSCDFPATQPGWMKCVCAVTHRDHTERTELALPVPVQMTVNDTQKAGAATSYARRYALIAALNLSTADDDPDATPLTPPNEPDKNNKKAPAKRKAAVITKKQAVELKDILSGWPADAVKRFEQYLEGLGLKSVEQIPARDHDKIRAMMLNRKDQNE